MYAEHQASGMSRPAANDRPSAATMDNSKNLGLVYTGTGGLLLDANRSADPLL